MVCNNTGGYIKLKIDLDKVYIPFVFPPALFVRRPPAGEFRPEEVLLF